MGLNGAKNRPSISRTIHNFITLKPFLRKSQPKRPHGLNFPRFSRILEKNYDEEKLSDI